MRKIKVTFDSNVWEKVVSGNNEFMGIRDSILSGKIEPYICEIAIALESIKKQQRLSFWKVYKSKSDIVREEHSENKFHGTICFAPNNEVHPGLHPVLKDCLRKANSLGFRVLTMTNIGTVRSPEIPDTMKISFSDIDDFWEYAEELSKCSKFIQALGAGSSEYFKIVNKYGLHGFSTGKSITGLPDSLEKKFYRSVAEWVDGDALSAHYAYKNDYFCTQDSGRSAGSKSVFSPDNLKRVTEKFNITVISASELSAL